MYFAWLGRLGCLVTPEAAAPCWSSPITRNTGYKRLQAYLTVVVRVGDVLPRRPIGGAEVLYI